MGVANVTMELRQWAIDRALTHLGGEADNADIFALAERVVAFVTNENPDEITWTADRLEMLDRDYPDPEKTSARTLRALNLLPGKRILRSSMCRKASERGLHRPDTPQNAAYRANFSVARAARTAREAA